MDVWKTEAIWLLFGLFLTMIGIVGKNWQWTFGKLSRIAALTGVLTTHFCAMITKTWQWTWDWCKTFTSRRERREVIGAADSISRSSIMPVHREGPMPFTAPIMEGDVELGLGKWTANDYNQGGNVQPQSTAP